MIKYFVFGCLTIFVLGCDTSEKQLILGHFDGELRLIASADQVVFSVGCYEGESSHPLTTDHNGRFTLPVTLYQSAGPLRRQVSGPIQLIGMYRPPEIQANLSFPDQALGPYQAIRTTQTISVGSLCLSREK